MSELARGKYIAFEGAEGSGKTINAKWLSNKIGADYGYEPGGGKVGQILRQIVKDPKIELTAEQQLAIFMAGRAMFANDEVEFVLASGRSFVTDRTWLSSEVYQGYVGGYDVYDIETLAFSAMGKLTIPDVTIFLDIDAETSIERLETRGTNTDDRFKQGGIEVRAKIVEGYAKAFERWQRIGRNIVRIDASQKLERVQMAILDIVNDL